jgi:hypothetical protein
MLCGVRRMGSRMLRGRAATAGITKEIGCLTSRATGLAAHLANAAARARAGGAREPAY